MSKEGFIAVDWGTTNRRAYLIAPDGRVIDEMEDASGVTSVAEGAFPAAIAQITERLGHAPMLLAGMIGSSRGWREVPYVACPARVEDVVAGVQWIEQGQVGIVPGLSIVEGDTGDVMRGEEVQVFGLLRREGITDCAICHPGTHTKWIQVTGGAVTRFRTAMTGEMFALLREHSILAPLLGREPVVGGAFCRGVACGQAASSLSAELFGIRAKVLLSLLAEDDAASFASGLLIGCDVKAAPAGFFDREVIVLGRPSLTLLYAEALRHCGARVRQIDGADAFVSGMIAIKEAAE
ncbi:MAG: 2-dehydro-3-deoxygalactonokinase [Pseudomonadota bacterium]